MKKTIVALLFAALGASAQTMDDSRFIMGAKLSYGPSFIYPYKNSVFHSSWAAGISTMYLFTDNVGAGADAMFSSEGATFKSGDLKSTEKIDYFRIPVRLYYVAGADEKNLRPRLGIGPSFGFIMDGSAPGYSSMDLGASVLAGIQYRLVHGLWLTLDADYYHGLTDIYSGNAESDHNANIRLDVGLAVGF